MRTSSSTVHLMHFARRVFSLFGVWRDRRDRDACEHVARGRPFLVSRIAARGCRRERGSIPCQFMYT